jgi:hypothetical protein
MQALAGTHQNGADTPLPKDLVLFQTRFDQYSLHPAERMSLTSKAPLPLSTRRMHLIPLIRERLSRSLFENTVIADLLFPHSLQQKTQ